jgi:hypothetical protein
MRESETKTKPKQKDILSRSEKAEISKEVHLRTTNVLNPIEFKQMEVLAGKLMESKSVPSCYENASQILMALQAGFEMGLKPVESMQSFYIVNGALNLWGKAVPRRLREHGYTIAYENEELNTTTVIVANKKYDEMYTETFTFKEAEDSGWTKNRDGSLKVGWRLGINRKLKLRYGALSTLIKTYLPDVLGSVTDIVEVATDFEIDNDQPAKISAETRIKKALKDSNIEKVDVKPIDQEQDDEPDYSKEEQLAEDLSNDGSGDRDGS